MSEEKGKTVGEIVLAGIRVKPQRLEAFEFVDSMFEDRQEREAFAFIAAEWEDKRPEEIDPELIRAAGHEDVADYLAGLQGWEPIGDEAFGIYYRRFREGQVKKSLVRKLDALARSKIPIEDSDVEELRPEWEALDRIEQADQMFDPYTFMRTGSQLQALDVHVDWTVDKLIPEGAITLLHGPAGLGKTWLCLAIAKAVSEGVPFLGLQTKKCEVVYIDYENPLGIDHDRACTMNVCAPHFWHLSDPTRPPKLDGPDWHLLKTLHRGSLIIIDTARGATDGDEIKGQDVALVMNRLKEVRELEHKIILQAHTSKANKKLSKGATTWEDLADHVLAFYRVRPGTLEEIEEEGFDPNALLYLGTGNKTRYEPCRYYVSLDATNGTFAMVNDPIADSINTLAGYIAGEGSGQNQTEILKWAKENLEGSTRTENLIALLKRGARDRRWRVRPGFRGIKYYEPPS